MRKIGHDHVARDLGLLFGSAYMDRHGVASVRRGNAEHVVDTLRLLMRAHAVVLLAVLALVTPARASRRCADRRRRYWDQGHQLTRRGDYAGAEQLYASMVDQFPASAPRALLLQARAAQADGDNDTAEALIQQLLDEYPSIRPARSGLFHARASASRGRRLLGRAARAGRLRRHRRSSVGRSVHGHPACPVLGRPGRLAGRARRGARCAGHRRRWPALDADRSPRASRRSRAQAGPQAGRVRLLQSLARSGRHARLQGRDAVHAPPRSRAPWGRTPWPPIASGRSSSTTPTRRARQARSTR